jgi:SSS family solute:Na+ symporter
MGATFITYSTGLGETEETVAPSLREGEGKTASRSEAATPPASAGAPAAKKAADPAASEAAHKARLSRQELTVNLVMTILIVVVLVYTVLGGMVSVIITDYLQFVVLAIGLAVGLYVCLFGHPDLGWDKLVGTLKTHRGEGAFNPVHRDSYGWLWVIWMFLHVVAAMLCWVPEASRILTARDSKTAQRTYLISSPGQFIRLGIPALFGIAAFVYVVQHPTLMAYFFPQGVGGETKYPEQAMPLVLGKIVPSGLLGILVAGMVAAFMSTHDSYFLAWASVITRDIVVPLKRRELTGREQVRLTRIVILLIGAFLLVWGLWYPLPKSVWNYMAVTGSMWLCGSGTVLIGGMIWRRASSAGGFAALLGGLMSVPIIFLPKYLQDSSRLMGLIGLENYALCVFLFVFFSLRHPDKAPSAPQEA